MKIKEIHDDYIVFDNGIIMKSVHDQDCCEEVLADFEYIKQYNMLGDNHKQTIYEIEFNENFWERDIQLVKGMGFIMIANDYNRSKVFVPCYNIQNGYYGDSLHLVIKVIKDEDDYSEEILAEIDLKDYKDDIVG